MDSFSSVKLNEGFVCQSPTLFLGLCFGQLRYSTERWVGLKYQALIWIWPLFWWERPGSDRTSRWLLKNNNLIVRIGMSGACKWFWDKSLEPFVDSRSTEGKTRLWPHHHQLLLGSALETPSVLLYHLVGTLRKCQADASEFITIRHHLFSWKIHEVEFPQRQPFSLFFCSIKSRPLQISGLCQKEIMQPHALILSSRRHRWLIH